MTPTRTLRPGITVVPDAGQGIVWLLLNGRILKLEAGASESLASFLTAAQRRGIEMHSSAFAVSLARQLSDRGLLESVDLDPTRAPLIRTLTDCGMNGSAILEAAQRLKVAVAGDGILARAVTTELGRCGFTTLRSVQLSPTVAEGQEQDLLAGADLVVVAEDVTGETLQESLNRTLLASGTAWMLIRRDGFRVQLGPLFIPHETPCYLCYERRVLANRTDYVHAVRARTVLDELGLRRATPDNIVSFVTTLASSWCAFEVILFTASRVQGTTPRLAGSFIRVSLSEPTVQTHRLLPVPRCPACAAGDHTLSGRRLSSDTP